MKSQWYFQLNFLESIYRRRKVRCMSVESLASDLSQQTKLPEELSVHPQKRNPDLSIWREAGYWHKPKFRLGR
jgi:hypothetical protein